MSNTCEAVHAALTRDPEPTNHKPLRLEEVVISAADGSRMCGVMLRAAGDGPHPTMLLFHGYPGLVNNRDLMMAVGRLGWNVVTFHYRGLWGSSGAFSFGNAIEDGRSALDFLTTPTSIARFEIDPARIVIAGHSLGGFVALRTAAEAAYRIIGVAALSAINLRTLGVLSRTPEGYEMVVELGKTEAPVAGTTMEKLLDELQHHQDEWDFLQSAAALHATPVLVVEAGDYCRAENQELVLRLVEAQNGHVTKRFIDTDHDFTSGRVALATEVLIWLRTI